jgi:pyruvate/2-oxoglutarate dehydrogenase complex dihydrolipoamide dehydrogenase (E3) component
MPETVDVVVIGMGPGGEEVAGALADAGLQVVGIDERLLGGECPYYGCVPSKMMIRAGNLLAEARRTPGMAGQSDVRPDWTPVALRLREDATDNWSDRKAAARFEGKGGRFVRGRARLVGPMSVSAGDDTYTARRAVVIATGTAPSVPPVPGLEDTPYWTNREAIEATEVPASLVVMGGGAVGAELGQMYARFGARVSVVESTDRLLGPEEPEASALVADVFAAEDIAVHTSARVASVAYGRGQFTVTVDGSEEISAHQLLVATGRQADLAGLGVDAVGLDAGARAIPVDDRLRAGPGLWAVGDVTGVGPFTHVAVYQARIAIDDILGREPHPAEYRAVPRVTFTDPEVGSVGLTQRAAEEKGVSVRTGTAQVSDSARGWIHKVGNRGFIKVVEDVDRGVLVGATSVGPVGGEVLSMLTLAVHGAVSVDQLRRMIYAYPTFHRGVEDALRDLAG